MLEVVNATGTSAPMRRRGCDRCDTVGLYLLPLSKEVNVHEHEVEETGHVCRHEVVGTYERCHRRLERCVFHKVQQAFGFAGVVFAYCDVEVVHSGNLSLSCSRTLCQNPILFLFRKNGICQVPIMPSMRHFWTGASPG